MLQQCELHHCCQPRDLPLVRLLEPGGVYGAVGGEHVVMVSAWACLMSDVVEQFGLDSAQVFFS